MTSNFTPLIPGVIHVTGEHDVGKTLFALQCGAHPSGIAFVDDDIKGRSTVGQLRASNLEFGYYCDLRTETRGLAQLGVYEKCMGIIDEMEKLNPDVIAWDTWSRFVSTLKPYVRKNMSKFREGPDWAAKGDIKGGQQWKEAQEYEAQIISRLNSIAPLVILVTHLKDKYIGPRKTDKQIPDATRTIAKVPVFRVWLRRNPSGSPVPIALVLKRISRTAYVDGEGLRTTNILPPRIEPQKGEMSAWDAIRRYIDDPVGDRELLPHEIPNEFERSLIEGTMTEDQKRAWMLTLAADADTDDMDKILESSEVLDTAQFITDMRDEGAEDDRVVRSLKEQGVSYKDIANAFASLGEEVSMLQVMRWCK